MLSPQEQQKQLLEAIDLVVSDRLSKTKKPHNRVGVLQNTPAGYVGQVKINREIIECHVPEHLHSWVQKDDVVMVQDAYGDGKLMIVIGKTGETQVNPTLVFYDKDIDRLISGVDMIVDSENGNDLGYGSIVNK